MTNNFTIELWCSDHDDEDFMKFLVKHNITKDLISRYGPGHYVVFSGTENSLANLALSFGFLDDGFDHVNGDIEMIQHMFTTDFCKNCKQSFIRNINVQRDYCMSCANNYCTEC